MKTSLGARTDKADKTSKGPFRLLFGGGLLLLAWCVALFFLLQAHSLWERPTLIGDKWPKVFAPIRDLFPRQWILAPRFTQTGLNNALLYLGLVATLFLVYLWVTSRVFRLRWAAPPRLWGRAFKVIIAFTVLAFLVLLFVPGSFTSDVFSYIW